MSPAQVLEPTINICARKTFKFNHRGIALLIRGTKTSPFKSRNFHVPLPRLRGSPLLILCSPPVAIVRIVQSQVKNFMIVFFFFLRRFVIVYLPVIWKEHGLLLTLFVGVVLRILQLDFHLKVSNYLVTPIYNILKMTSKLHILSVYLA